MGRLRAYRLNNLPNVRAYFFYTTRSINVPPRFVSMHFPHLISDLDKLLSDSLLYFHFFISLGTVCSSLRGDLRRQGEKERHVGQWEPLVWIQAVIKIQSLQSDSVERTSSLWQQRRLYRKRRIDLLSRRCHFANHVEWMHCHELVMNLPPTQSPIGSR